MGIFKFVFIGFLPSLGLSLFLSLRLGNKLPIICRETGRNFGMFYNYFKILLFHFKPKERQSNEIVQMLRNINQQSGAFTREFQSNLMSAKKDLREIMPGMKVDPFKNIGLKVDQPITMDEDKKLSGTKILEHSIIERRRIVKKKKNQSDRNTDFYN